MPQFGGAAAGPGPAAGGFGGPQLPGPGLGEGGFGGMAMGASDRRNEHENHADALIDLMTTNVDPESWQEVGGPGSVSAYHGLIVVTQTARTHKKIERVLDMLREAAGLEVGGVKKVVR